MLLYLLIHIKRFFHTPPLLQLAGRIIRSHSSHRRLQQRKIIQKNSQLNPLTLRKIVNCFSDPHIGCIVGETRIAVNEKDSARSGEAGFY